MMRRLIFSGTFSLLSLFCVKFLPVSTVSSLVNTSPIFIFFIESLYYRVIILPGRNQSTRQVSS